MKMVERGDSKETIFEVKEMLEDNLLDRETTTAERAD